jgi:hypothetical protein
VRGTVGTNTTTIISPSITFHSPSIIGATNTTLY